MHLPESDRRQFAIALASLGFAALVPDGVSAGTTAPPTGAVLAAAEGEHLIHFRDGGDIFIKASAAAGFPDLAVGTQQVKVGTGIPTHRHPAMSEAFFVLAGSGTVVLDDVRHPFDKGATIVIPKNTWHSFENPAQELLVLWIVSPAGLESFFRETCSAPGAPPKGLSREQTRAIALRYGTEFK